MNPRLLAFAADLLKVAAERLDDDVVVTTPATLTDADMQELADLCDLSNGAHRHPNGLVGWRAEHPDEFTTANAIRGRVTDYVAMSAMAFMLREAAKATEAPP